MTNPDSPDPQATVYTFLNQFLVPLQDGCNVTYPFETTRPAPRIQIHRAICQVGDGYGRITWWPVVGK